jgi:hypothetical protein
MEKELTKPTKIQDLGILFHDALRNLQAKHPYLIPEAIEVARGLQPEKVNAKRIADPSSEPKCPPGGTGPRSSVEE